jgi:glycosyltransferase involved in cell wall biosynthesis
MIILSHPTANQFVRYATSGLVNAQMLQSFYTSLACFENDFLYKIGGNNKFSEIRKRVFDNNLKPFINTNPTYEMIRQIAMKFGFKDLIKHEFGKFSVDAIYANHDKWVSEKISQQILLGAKAVYAYEDAALKSFSIAKQNGLTNFYDLSIGYWRRGIDILEKEKERQPLYANTLTGLLNSAQKLARKDEELELANHVIVASTFTKDSLNFYPNKLNNIEVIPYGFPTVNNNIISTICCNKPLKILYVGGLTQRKGIAEVFDIANLFGKHVTLTVIGNKTSNECEELDRNLQKHTWIPSLPHHEILNQMQQHDILLLPSLFEGFGMVISEAMSQGTPVITTYNTAGKDFIEHGKNGWLVEPGNLNAIAQITENIIDSPEQLEQIKNNAKATAMERPWSKYALEIAEFVKSKIETC